MRPETYRMLAEREDSYWWHTARRALSTQLLTRCEIPHGCCWLDLGCGSGGNLPLSEAFAASFTVGIDVSQMAISIAHRKKPGAILVRADLNNPLPFDDGVFDVATVFNVLYHEWVKNDAEVIVEISRVLRPGGVFFITEPAFAILTREMDIAAMGHRRYRITDIASLCNAGGLQVELATYFTSFGFPLLIAMRALRWLKRAENDRQFAAAADMKRLNKVANGLLLGLSGLESRAIAAGWHFPFGTTLLCLARKT
jgi:SAM-dependent methyltransferase